MTREVWLSLKNDVGPALSDEVMADFLMTDGVFYDLLPGGTEVDTSSVRMYHGTNSAVPNAAMNKGAIPSSAYTVSFDYDWEGTSMTMMKIEFHLPENLRKWSTVYYDTYQRITVRYLLKNSYANIRDRGVTVMNTCAFVNLSDKTQIAAVDACQIDKLNHQAEYQSLYNTYGDEMVFTQKAIPFDDVLVTQSGFNKRVKSDSDTMEKLEARALVGDSYKYSLSYTVSGNTTADRIVFYDELETYEGTQWKGTLLGVDIGAIKGKTSKLV